MTRTLTATAVALLLACVPAHAGGAYTTRIVPAHAFGATVTIEEGVRVFRPLPSDRHVIVDPKGETEIEVKVHEYAVPSNTIRR